VSFGNAAGALPPIKTSISQRYSLAEVGLAHGELESRRTTGSTVLLP
jgi:NADPH2:quinone reductase